MDRRIEFGHVDEGVTSDQSAAEFVEQNIEGHQKIELTPEQQQELALPRVELAGGEKDTLEYQVGDFNVRIDYEKFHFAEWDSDDAASAMEKYLSPALASYGLSPDQLNNLYFLKAARLIPASGEEVDLLEGARFTAIIFSGNDLGMSSRFNPMTKMLFISKSLNTERGLLHLIHEVSHEVTIQEKAKKNEVMAAIHSIKTGKRKPEDLRISVMTEVEASDRTYQLLRQSSHDEEFLSLAEAALMEALSKHIVGLQKGKKRKK